MDDFAFDLGNPNGIAQAMHHSDLSLDLQQWTRALAQAEQEAAQSPAGEVKARALLTAARANWHLDDFLGCTKLAIQCLANKNLETPTHIAVHAMTLAAFALNELGATDQARILAQRALVLTRLESLFDLLPTALSCAACIDSCSGELDRAETFHMEALSHARRSTNNDSLQLALGNLLISYIDLLRDASNRGDEALADAVRKRSRRSIVQVRNLKEDPGLSQWRRLSLQQKLGELLGLCGEQQEAERLLRDCLDQSTMAGDAYSTQTIAIALAEQLETRGAHQEALELLRAHVHPDTPGRGSYRRRLQAMRIAESCLRNLHIADALSRMSECVARDLQEWAASREEAIRYVTEAGYFAAELD